MFFLKVVIYLFIDESVSVSPATKLNLNIQRFLKEINDIKIIDDAVKLIAQSGQNDSLTHFIYCGESYFEDILPLFWGGSNNSITTKKFKEIILSKMIKYRIGSAVLTMLLMQRQNLITKEKAKLYSENKSHLKDESLTKKNEFNGSINDDLEAFVTNFSNSNVKEEMVWSFFTPKLSKKELKLVEMGDKEHLKTYWKINPDVKVEVMKKSDSKDKYVKAECRRVTMYLTVALQEKLSRKTMKGCYF